MLNRLELTIFLALTSLLIVYSLVTNHVWEDYWITYRHSKNLALGIGLQYHPQERLHGFTSPLGTLLPALIAWLSGTESDYRVLWIFRGLCAVVFAATGVLLWRVLQRMGVRREFALLAVFILAFDIKSVDFSVNGMETAYLLFFIALSLYFALDTTAPTWKLGLAWAGLLWSRPDGCVYIAAMALAFLCSAPGLTRAQWVQRFSVAGLWCALAYAPWFLWAWSYFGTPVPHTIVAKSGANSLYVQMMKILNLPFKFLPGIPELEYSAKGPAENIHLFLFAPSYIFSRATAVYSLFLFSAVAIFAVIAKPSTRDDLTASRKSVALYALFIALYLYLIPSNYPWYIPGCALLFIMSLSSVAEHCASRFTERKVARVFTVVACVQVLLFVLGTFYNQVRQQVIEQGHRQQIGLWLAANASKDSTVFLECLGYIGYYSGLQMRDYPGLVAPEVVKARKTVGPDMGDVIKTLLPDYLVLRPNESLRIQRTHPGMLQEHYELVKTFDANPAIDAYAWVPWRYNLRPDSRFGIFKNRRAGQRKIEVARLG